MSERTASKIIATVVASGLSRAHIARALGCSRMHLWRIERGKIGRNSRISKLIEDRFGSKDQPKAQLQAFEREALAAIRAIIKDDQTKSRTVLQMLRLLQHLAAGVWHPSSIIEQLHQTAADHRKARQAFEQGANGYFPSGACSADFRSNKWVQLLTGFMDLRP